MSKVYLVTSGCYSDYSVNSVWSTRELAEKEVDRMKEPEPENYSRSLDAEIEEFVLDGWGHDRQFWCVSFHGDSTTAERLYGRLSEDTLFVGKHRYQTHGNGRFTVSSDDASGAIKVAAERRASLLVKYSAESEVPGRWEEVS